VRGGQTPPGAEEARFRPEPGLFAD
jgi:hypothetical protein